MKQGLIVLALALVASVPVAANADPPESSGARDMVVGSAKYTVATGETRQITLSAHSSTSDPGLQPATGHVRLFIGGTEARGTVDCMEVNENIGFVEGSLDPPVAGIQDFVVTVVDGGNPNGATPDRVAVGEDQFPEPCQGGFPFDPLPVTHGNLVVKNRQ